MSSKAPKTIAAAIDIGSNSIKMTVGREDGEGGIDQFDWASEVVRLGQGVDQTGRLDEKRVEIAIETLTRFAARARELGATRVIAVATEATRTAENGEPFLERVRQMTGIDVRVVDGQEEAALTFRGLAASTEITGSVVVADIGGGSTELIVARDGVMQAAQSLALGSGRLTDQLIASDPPQSEELSACEAEAGSAIQKAAEILELPTGAGTRLIVVGGTGEFMARLVPDDRNIDIKTVRHVLTRLAAMAAADLAVEIDIPVARARVLPAGVTIVAAIATRLSPDLIEISRSGIRTGLLLEAFHGADGAMAQNGPRPQVTEADTGTTKTRKNGSEDRQPTLDSNFRETMKAMIAERWAAIWKSIPAALEGTDIEGVHDVRVASRRLRAAMDIAAPAFSRGWYRPLHQVAKDITGALGEVRDRDVLLESLRADRAMAPSAEHPGIDRLIERVESERVVARTEMERYLRELMDGDLWRDVERWFGSVQVRSKGSNTPDGNVS